LRLIFEIWSSRLSLTALVVAGFLYLNSALFRLEMFQSPANLIAGFAESTIVLLAHFSLLASVAFYARHVLLDATGRLKVHIDPDRKGKAKRAKLKVVKSEKHEETNRPAVPASKPSEPSRFGSTPAASSPVAKPGATIAKNNISAPEEEYDEDDDDDYGGSNLSKSERRRLKKLARREQQRRAA
jgi:hypothetical protein